MPMNWHGMTATDTVMYRLPSWGPLIIVPLRSGKLQLGIWQQVVAVNHDNRACQRRKTVSKKCFSQFVLGRLVHIPEPWVVSPLVPASFDHADLG
jgi:hypothetical protein